jgi:prevent-host-death family protein
VSKQSGAWSVADAKARLSEVLERAITKGPQTITRNGRPAAVVVSVEEWLRKSRRKGNLAELFAASPLRASGVSVEREKPRARRLRL